MQTDDLQPYLSILQSAKTIAIVGLPPKPERQPPCGSTCRSRVPHRAHQPFGHRGSGRAAWPSLTEAAKHHRIDLVDVFRDSVAVPPIADGDCHRRQGLVAADRCVG